MTRVGPRPRVIVLTLAVAAFIVIEGLASTRIGFAPFEFRYAILALLTGWLVAALGLAAAIRSPNSRTGWLLVVVAATWFVGGFRWVAFQPLAELASAFDLVYLGVASHTVLTFPTGRATLGEVRALVSACYLATVVPLPRADVLYGGVALVAISVVALRSRGASGDRRRALFAGAGLAVVAAGHRVVPAWIGGLDWLDVRPVLLVALLGVALVLAGPLIRPRPGAGRIADLVVELGSNPRADLLADLAELIGDPDMRLGMWYPAGRQYVDAFGRPVEITAEDGTVTGTLIADDGEPLAILVHAADIRPDPDILSAVRMAARLSIAHARLQADVRAQVLAVRASRRRLLVAGDEERSSLEARLRSSLEPRIDALETSLRAPGLSGEPAAATALEQLRQTRVELDALIAGIGPPDLSERGISGALEGLASSTPIPLEIHVETAEIPSRDARSALIFVAREALANIGKHSGATSATLRLSSRHDIVRLDVTDDGRGGADMGNGTGLQGLRDRVEALGGQLVLTSPLGEGTRVSASMPIRDPS